MSWAIPFVTGHKYKISWGPGLDFDKFEIDLSEKWQYSDKNIIIMHNFTNVRAAFNVTYNNKSLFNNTLPSLNINDASILTG